MSINDQADKRRETYEQIRVSELARGASEDEAARTAAETVDKVLASQEPSS